MVPEAASKSAFDWVSSRNSAPLLELKLAAELLIKPLGTEGPLFTVKALKLEFSILS